MRWGRRRQRAGARRNARPGRQCVGAEKAMCRGRKENVPRNPRSGVIVLNRQNKDTVAQRHRGSFAFTDWDQTPRQPGRALGRGQPVKAGVVRNLATWNSANEHRNHPASQFTPRRRETLPLPETHHEPMVTARHPPELHGPRTTGQILTQLALLQPERSRTTPTGPAGHAPGTPGKTHTPRLHSITCV